LAGKDVKLSDFRGKVVVVFFGFTQCPDVCPTTLAELTAAKQLLGTAGADVQGVFVSVDPARDTPARIGPYVRYFDEHFEAATGPEDALTALTRQIAVFEVADIHEIGFESDSEIKSRTCPIERTCNNLTHV
jgi:protein SCO1/2